MNQTHVNTLLAEVRWLTGLAFKQGLHPQVALSTFGPTDSFMGIQVHLGDGATMNLEVEQAVGGMRLRQCFNSAGLSTSFSWNSAEMNLAVTKVIEIMDAAIRAGRGALSSMPSLHPNWDGYTKQWFDVRPSAVRSS